ncbi:MAG: ABC transporter permease [Chloroflexota bacterium]|nr:ABC transporter permease [Chloroflexota bacterium]
MQRGDIAVAPAPGGQAAPGTPRYGEVFDRGYQRYGGTRLGRGHGVWAVARYSMRRAMGFKKSWSSKVIPFFVYIAAALTAMIPIGIEAFIDQEAIDYPDFFGLLYVLQGIFIATIAPEFLCSDRRENVLSLYFCRSITRLDYLLGKLLGTGLLALTVTLAPALVLWFGRQLLADAPLDALWSNLPDLGRLLLVGVLLAIYLAAGGLAISSFTGRKSIAVAVIIVGIVVVESLVGLLGVALEGDFRRYSIFVSPTTVTAGLSSGIFWAEDPTLEFPWWGYGIAMVVTILVCLAVMYRRYVHED